MCIHVGHIFQPSFSWQALYMTERQSNNKSAILLVNSGRHDKYMILMKGDWLTQAQDKKRSESLTGIEPMNSNDNYWKY